MRQTMMPMRLTSAQYFLAWVNGYISLLAFCLLSITYLDLANYFSCLSYGAFLPKYAYYALGAAVVPLFVLRRNVLWSYLRSRYIMLVGALVLLNLLHWVPHYLDGNAEAASLTMTRVQYLILAAMLAFVLIQARPALLGKIFVFLALFLTVLQVSDFLFPGMIVPVGIEGRVAGRASSTLINANKAAESLVLLAILGMPFMRPNWRIWLLLVVFPGVLVSFSRSGLMAWVLTVAGGFWLRIFPRSTYLLMLSFVPLLLSVAASLPDLVLSHVELGAMDNVYSRLMFFSTLDTSDFSAHERIAVSKYALESYFSHPFLGHGAGYTHLWIAFREAPHNQHLLMLVEYGVVGYTLFVWLLVQVYRGGAYFRDLQLHQMTKMAFAVVLAFTPFTHNMFDNLYWLVTFALISQRRLYTPK